MPKWLNSDARQSPVRLVFSEEGLWMQLLWESVENIANLRNSSFSALDYIVYLYSSGCFAAESEGHTDGNLD